MMDRIPSARDLTTDEMMSLRSVVGGSFTPNSQINALQKKRLIALGLIHSAMGGLMPTPAGRIVARM
jgi:hypothetical protein